MSTTYNMRKRNRQRFMCFIMWENFESHENNCSLAYFCVDILQLRRKEIVIILFLTIFPLYICYSVSRFVCCMLQFNLNGQCVFIFSLILITSTFSNICIAAFFQIIHYLFFKNHLAMLFLMSQSHMFHFGIYFFSLSWLCLVNWEPKGKYIWEKPCSYGFTLSFASS